MLIIEASVLIYIYKKDLFKLYLNQSIKYINVIQIQLQRGIHVLIYKLQKCYTSPSNSNILKLQHKIYLH